MVAIPPKRARHCVINLGVIATFASAWEQFSAVIPPFIPAPFLLHHSDPCTVTKQQLAEAIKQLNVGSGNRQHNIGCKCWGGGAPNKDYSVLNPEPHKGHSSKKWKPLESSFLTSHVFFSLLSCEILLSAEKAEEVNKWLFFYFFSTSRDWAQLPGSGAAETSPDKVRIYVSDIIKRTKQIDLVQLASWLNCNPTLINSQLSFLCAALRFSNGWKADAPIKHDLRILHHEHLKWCSHIPVTPERS